MSPPLLRVCKWEENDAAGWGGQGRAAPLCGAPISSWAQPTEGERVEQGGDVRHVSEL